LQLNHAIAGKTEPFEHVNIDWNFVLVNCTTFTSLLCTCTVYHSLLSRGSRTSTATGFVYGNHWFL